MGRRVLRGRSMRLVSCSLFSSEVGGRWGQVDGRRELTVSLYAAPYVTLPPLGTPKTNFTPNIPSTQSTSSPVSHPLLPGDRKSVV